MTVQEAKEVIEDFDKCVTVKADGCYETIDYIKAKEIAIERMEEVEQYRALGTVEELKEAKKLLEKLEELKFANEQSKTDWIPCEERLPELDGGNEYFKQSKCVLVAIEWLDGEITEEVGWYNEGGAWNHDSKNCKVIAWQPLPQPYKKEGNSNENT